MWYLAIISVRCCILDKAVVFLRLLESRYKWVLYWPSMGRAYWRNCGYSRGHSAQLPTMVWSPPPDICSALFGLIPSPLKVDDGTVSLSYQTWIPENSRLCASWGVCLFLSCFSSLALFISSAHSTSPLLHHILMVDGLGPDMFLIIDTPYSK